MRQDELIKDIARTMNVVDPTVQVILYGSQARGDAHEKSDVDLLLLTEDNNITLARRQELTWPLYQLEIKSGISISTRVTTKSEWENRPVKTPFYHNVMKEGVLL